MELESSPKSHAQDKNVLATVLTVQGKIGNRIYWLDVIKGIAIILVVYGHTARGLESAGRLTFNGVFGIIDYAIYLIHMPVFFAVSGFIFQKSLSSEISMYAFFKGKAQSIVWPYLLWTTVSVAAQTVMSGSGALNNPMTWDRLLSIGWDPVSPFWFLYALFCCFSLSYFIRRAPIILLITISAAAMALAIKLSAPQIAIDIAYGFLYFSIGRSFYLEPTHLKKKATLAVSFFVFTLFTYIGIKSDIDVRLNLIGTLAGIHCLYIISHALAKTRLLTPLLWIGRCTMGVYVMHIMVIVAFRALGLKAMHVEPLLVLFISTPMGIILPIIFQAIVNNMGIGVLMGMKTKLPSRWGTIGTSVIRSLRPE